MSIPLPFTGGCACGRVRYECRVEPQIMFNCHCRDCQYASGSAYTAALIVPLAALQLITGEPRYFERVHADGRTIARGFCPECGTPLFARRSVTPEAIGIRAGTLDDPAWFEPRADFWVSSAQPWDHMNPAVTKFESQPAPPPRPAAKG